MPIPWARDIPAIREFVGGRRDQGATVGFVPTMGALHRGHAALIREARRGADVVVVSIFVNPTQFGAGEDLARYPRTPEADALLCEDAGAHAIFAPDADAMYPSGPAGTFVEVPGLTEVLEGRSRPGHFRGVATVVLKLFGIVRPDRAWFGLKDYQQWRVIRTMVRDLDVPVEILGVPTVREADGLALSSRNAYLGPEDRAAAVVLWRSLEATRRAVEAGERSGEALRDALGRSIAAEPRADLDYAEIADARTLRPLRALTPGEEAVALVAARFGTTRLIDNRILTP